MQNPIHTFPAFDSAYRVCLSITNSCGTSTFCDTAWVDSLGLTLNNLGKRGADDPVVSGNKPGMTKPVVQLKSLVYQLDNIPNPFNEETMISYQVGAKFTHASLRITDVLGRTIRDLPVSHLSGKIPFNAASHSGGMYYVSLVVDDVVVKSKTPFIDK